MRLMYKPKFALVNETASIFYVIDKRRLFYHRVLTSLLHFVFCIVRNRHSICNLQFSNFFFSLISLNPPSRSWAEMTVDRWRWLNAFFIILKNCVFFFFFYTCFWLCAQHREAQIGYITYYIVKGMCDRIDPIQMDNNN